MKHRYTAVQTSCFIICLLLAGIFWSHSMLIAAFAFAAAILLLPYGQRPVIWLFKLCLAGIILYLAVFNSFRQHPTADTGNMTVSFLDVGQGDSILIQTPDHKTILIDAGIAEQGETVVTYLKQADVDEIDYLIGTHPHEDHIGGFFTVLQSISVKQYIQPEIRSYDLSDNILNKNLILELNKRSIPIINVKSGDKLISSDTYTVEVLSPAEGALFEDLNDYSLILKLTYGKISFLLTGDAGYTAELEILSRDLAADVLKIGHHGSFGSTCTAFLEAVDPEIAVISVGADNEHNHPNHYVMDRLNDYGISVYRTDQDGTVSFTTDGRSLNITLSKDSGKQ